MRQFILFAATIAMAAAALGSEWIHVAGGETHIRVYIELDSIAKFGVYKKAWFKFSYKNPGVVPVYAQLSNSATPGYSEIKELDCFSCAEHTTATLQQAFLRCNGKRCAQLGIDAGAPRSRKSFRTAWVRQCFRPHVTGSTQIRQNRD